GLIGKSMESALDDREIDRHAGFGCRDMQRDRRLEEVGTHQGTVEAAHPGGEQCFDIVVAALLAARGDRLHARGAQAERAKSAKERRGDERLADAGVGPGDEEPGVHSSSSSSNAVRSTRSSISSGSIT